MVDRSKAPTLQPIEELQIPEPAKEHLDNGIEVYRLNIGDQQVVQMEMIFRAGRWYEPKELVSNLTARMLKEGTTKHSSAEIADKIDFYGAELSTKNGVDRSTIQLTCLAKHFDKMVALIHELLTESTFPNRELSTITLNQQQKLQLNLQKNDYLANNHFQSALYGDHHPYGYSATPQQYDDIDREELQAFFQSHYTANNCFIIIAGNAPEESVKTLNQQLGGENWVSDSTRHVPDHSLTPYNTYKHHLEGPQHLQSAICMGMPLIDKTHPDYPKLSVLNTVFGGYFGSRLMGNLREKNGYTYGVHSRLVSHERSGHLKIETEVGTDVKDKAIHEIYSEMERLQNEKIPEEELRMVRNYLQGMMLNQLDGPFRIARTLTSIYTHNLDIDYLYKLIDTIKHITSDELSELAIRYLDEANMYEVAIG